MPVNFDEIRELLAAIAQTNIGEFILKSDDFELTVRKTIVAPTPPVAPPPVPSETASVAPVAPPPTPSAAPSTPPASAPPMSDNTLIAIKSPMVGTFYEAPSPGEEPFVKIGDRVRPDQTVCIIEAMKLMNEVEAEVSGQVVEILVQNGDPVEYDQPLMRIKPE